jgi:hypothetical protein
MAVIPFPIRHLLYIEFRAVAFIIWKGTSSFRHCYIGLMFLSSPSVWWLANFQMALEMFLI